MKREEIIQNKVDKLNKYIKMCKPFELDEDGDIVEFKIAKCINDEDGRNDMTEGEYYEVESIDNSYGNNYKLKNIGIWYPAKFFTEVEVIKIICRVDYYEVINE